APEASAVPAAVMVRAERADSLRESFTEADVAFMAGMIHHHAQAIVMADMAPTHGPSASLQVLAARIINAQRDEIALMQAWLRERGQPVREPMTAMQHGEHSVHGGGHAVHMPGMLTPEQLARLDGARGREFERLFLTYMIQHHEGAVTMVNELFATYGAAQGDAIFKLASDIGADQRTEIERMRSMLRDLIFETGSAVQQ
ncbi:MAG TPA: DUF305 domain-containing protein, partial [Longimicrobiales bacterium]|nr:DUF305 domain-containing protein [Longimicrobiales bacterium]